MRVMIGQAIEFIKRRLREVNIVSFSGGKDSTVVLSLVLEAMRDRKEKLYIVTADTLMEIPYFQSYIEKVRAQIKTYVDASSINAEMVLVRPELKDSFWVSVLGKGYPAAHMGFRWCTGKLKIDPITEFTRRVTAGVDHAAFIGVRRAESALRARIYKSKDYKPRHHAPVLDWSSHDIWEYLLTNPAPWGGNHVELVNVYKYSSDECVYGEAQGVCVGNARYGCWACPLQKETQLDMIGYHTNDRSRYAELKRFKKLLVAAANNSNLRSRIRRNGDVGTGPFLVEVRQQLLSALRKVELETGWELIRPDEIFLIEKHWSADAGLHNTPNIVQKQLWPTRWAAGG